MSTTFFHPYLSIVYKPTTKRRPVAIGGATFLPNQQHADNPAWLHALASAHRKEIAFCLCRKSESIPLSVKKYARSKISHYGLARWPGTNWDHDADCRFFCEDLESGKGDDLLAAFDELEDGRIRAYLARTLTIAASAETAVTPPGDASGKAGRFRARASDRSLLYRIWREANLNIFSEKETSWFLASLRAMHAATRFVVARDESTLADHLLIGAIEHNSTAIAHNAAVLERASTMKTRLYVLARLRAPAPAQLAKPAFLLPAIDAHGLPKIMVGRTLLERIMGEHSLMRSSLEEKSGHVVVLCCIEPNGGEWWKCVDIAGFVASKAMIPLQSSHDIVMERYLVAENRRFVKPLPESPWPTAGNHRPDFILLDTHPRCRIEMSAGTIPEFREAKERRLQRYPARKISVLLWDADRGDPLPTLPPKAE